MANPTGAARRTILTDPGLMLTDTGSFNDYLRQINQMIIFDPAVLDLTTDVFYQIFSGQGSQDLSQPLPFFRFFMNPSNLSVQMTKTSKTRLTKKGFETIHWEGTPTEAIPMAFSGYSGTFYIPPALSQDPALKIRDTKFSLNWQRFKIFERFVNNLTGDVVMLYDGTRYEGVVNNLKYDESADSPYGIKYSFVFTAYPDRIQPLISPDALFASIPVVSPLLSAPLQTGINF